MKLIININMTDSLGVRHNLILMSIGLAFLLALPLASWRCYG
jgi:hypothetical protein